MSTPIDPNDPQRARQRAGVRRTVVILAVVALAAYGLFLWSMMRGGA